MIKPLKYPEKEQNPEQIRETAFKSAYRKIIKYNLKNKK